MLMGVDIGLGLNVQCQTLPVCSVWDECFALLLGGHRCRLVLPPRLEI
jgi:hypothetical protein